MNDDFCLTSADVERLAGVSEITVIRWRRSGKIRARRIGRRVFLHSEMDVLSVAGQRLAALHEHEKRNPKTVRTDKKLRAKLTAGIVPLLGNGVNFGHATEIAKGLGYESVSDLTPTAVDSLIRALTVRANQTSQQFPASTEQPAKRKIKAKKIRSAADAR